MTHWHDHITALPAVCHGKPCVRGTRVLVSVVLDNLADGLTADEIVAEYPPLTRADVSAAVRYAATLVREEELVPPAGGGGAGGRSRGWKPGHTP